MVETTPSWPNPNPKRSKQPKLWATSANVKSNSRRFGRSEYLVESVLKLVGGNNRSKVVPNPIGRTRPHLCQAQPTPLFVFGGARPKRCCTHT